MGMDSEQRILAKMGLKFEVLDSGCCGMAGGFGYEREHFAISRDIGERVLLPTVRQTSEDTLIIADGFSCRGQIAQLTNRKAMHLAEAIGMALRDSRDENDSLAKPFDEGGKTPKAA